MCSVVDDRPAVDCDVDIHDDLLDDGLLDDGLLVAIYPVLGLENARRSVLFCIFIAHTLSLARPLIFDA